MIKEMVVEEMPSSILDQLDEISRKRTLTSLFQRSFLCQLIKEYRPKKLVEVGIAAGGTGAVLLECLSTINIDAQMFAVDLMEQYIFDSTKRSGYIIDEAKEKLSKCCAQKILLGKYLPEQLELIGNDIDFVFLDTVHCCPGEILDFLAILPYLKDGAVVALHDVNLQHCGNEGTFFSFATKLLYDVVTADKIIMKDNQNNVRFPEANIGTFIVNEDTRKNIIDVFSCLSIYWPYMPSERELNIYWEWYKKFYGNLEMQLFEKAIELHSKKFKQRKSEKELVVQLHSEWEEVIKKPFYLYGHGNWAKEFAHYLKDRNIDFYGFVVTKLNSDEKMDEEFEKEVYEISSLMDKKKDVSIVVAVSLRYFKEIKQILKDNEFENVFPNGDNPNRYARFKHYYIEPEMDWICKL